MKYTIRRDGAAYAPGRRPLRAVDLYKICETCGRIFERARDRSGRLEKAPDWRGRRYCSRRCASKAGRRMARIATASQRSTIPTEGAPYGMVIKIWRQRYAPYIPRDEAQAIAGLIDCLPRGDEAGFARAADRGLRAQMAALGWRHNRHGWTKTLPCDDRGRR